MWIFADFGLLMPSTAPMDKADPTLTEDGKYDLQIRGRLESHLRFFMDNYMVPGTFHDEIELTPQMDYNCRFYTTHEAFAEGMKNAILAIDYRNFKNQSERKNPDGTLKFKDAKKYHGILMRIWGVVQGLNTPGGFYGAYDPVTNPKGFKSRGSYRGGHYSRDDKGYVPTTFGQTELDAEPSWWNIDKTERDDFDDYVPEKADEIDRIIEEVEGLPADQWEDFLDEHDWALVKDIAAAIIVDERRATKADRKAARKFNRTMNRKRKRFAN